MGFGDGGTKLEIIAVIFPSVLLTFISTLLSSILHINFPLEFLLIVVQLILSLTLYVPFIYEVNITLALISLFFCVLFTRSKFELTSQKCNVGFQNSAFIINARSTLHLLTCISILAVDFYVFPRHFMKTNTYGYSLMDVGVGLFVFTSGIVGVNPKTYKSFLNILRSVLPIFCLGLGRLFVTRQFEYHVPVGEYGTHWNFFMTLFVVKLLTALIMNCVGSKYILINAISLLFAHEVLLQMGLADFVFGNAERDTFVNANREGIVSSLGYVSLYFLSVHFGNLLEIKKDKTFSEKCKLLKKLFLLTGLLLFSTVYLEKSFGVSRRLANTGYCIWVLFIGVFMTTMYFLIEIVQQYLFEIKGCSKPRYVPDIFLSINYNGLTFFLIGNLLTGLVNIVLDTLEFDPLLSISIITGYMLVCCSIMLFMYKKEIKLKL